MTGHNRSITKLAFIGGSRLLSGGADSKLVIWDINKGIIIQML